MYPKKMARGGSVDNEDKSVDKYLEEQFGNVPGGTMSPTPPTPSNPMLAQTNSGAAEETPTQQNIEDKVQDSHPGHKPDDLLRYIQGQEAQVDKYGPEQEKQVLDSIAKSQGTLGSRLSRGAAGLGDAIMGVAGKEGPGFLKSLEEREATNNARAANTIPALQNLNLQNMGQKEKLEGMSSATPIGASEMAPLAAFFEKVGIPKAQIPSLLQNPAAARSVVEPFATMMSNEQKIQMETLLKQLDLNLQSKKMKIEGEKQASQENQFGETQKAKALEDYGKMSFINRLLHPNIASKLEERSGLNEKSPSEFDHSTIHHGETYQAPDGSWRRKR